MLFEEAGTWRGDACRNWLFPGLWMIDGFSPWLAGNLSPEVPHIRFSDESITTPLYLKDVP